MNVIITESQYKKVILEQPEEKFDTPANKEFLRTGKYPTDKDFVGLGIDDTIDVLYTIKVDNVIKCYCRTIYEVNKMVSYIIKIITAKISFFFCKIKNKICLFNLLFRSGNQ